MHEKSEYMGCNCGNIMMQGHHFCEGDRVNLGGEELCRTADLCASVFVIGPKAVSITRFDKASAKLLTDAVVHLKCDMCRISFKIVIPRPDSGDAYVQTFDEVQFNRRRRMSAPCKGQLLTVMFPPQLKPFVVEKARYRVAESITAFIRNQTQDFGARDGIESDSLDPESMFNEEPSVTIGTYTENWHMPNSDSI